MNIKKFNSYHKAIEYIRNLDKSGDTLLYRGQASNKWYLEPAFYRENKIKSLDFKNKNIEYEKMIDHFSKLLVEYGYNYSKFTIDSNFKAIDYESLAQHYGVPTKLMDFSYSPYVALFFAFDGCGNSTNRSGYASVYIFNYTCYLNKICKEYKTELPEIALRTMKDYGQYIEKIEAISSLDERIRRQKGLFMYANYSEPCLTEFLAKRKLGDTFTRIDISTRNKSEILKDLSFMNLTPGYLMADLPGVCQTVKNEIIRF